MEKKTEIKTVGFGFFDALAILFIALKLCGVISWSWIAVLAPLWIQLILAVIGFIAFISTAGKLYKDDWMR